MDLDKISIEPRIRSPWEAVDLGFVMAKAWYKPLFLTWVLPSLPIYCILLFFFYDSEPWLISLVVWWFKPLWDRGPLHYASIKLFGGSTSVTQVMREIPSTYWNDFLPWLSWRRLSPSRSFDLPVTLLEKLKGSTRSSRLSILHRTNSNAASWLTIVLVHVESFILLGAMAFILLMIPENMEVNWDSLINNDNNVVDIAQSLCIYLAMSLVAPFYVMSGFALYLNRRIEIEAWDIEIRFRHIAKTFSQKTAKLSGTLSVFLALTITVSLCITLPTPSIADENTHSSIKEINAFFEKDSEAKAPIEINNKESAKTLIDQVLSEESFNEKKIKSGWRLKEKFKDDEEKEQDEEVPQWLIFLVKGMEAIGGFFGYIFSSLAVFLQFTFWVIVISVFLYFIYRYRDNIRTVVRGIQTEKSNLEDIPTELFGLDVREESLPEDVPEQVLKLWHAKKYRSALGLLYRATISHLIHQWGFNFDEGFTEGECVALVKRDGEKTVSDYTQQLTTCWQQIAYGHRPPSTEKVEALCEQWREVFSHAE